jgi:integrase/recombinase XerD
MQYFVNDQLVLSQVPEGPFAGHLRAFADSLIVQGYAARYLHRQVMLAAGFSRWLKRRSLSARAVRSEHAAAYLRSRHRRRRPSRGDGPALRHFLDFLRCIEIVPAEKIDTPPPTPAEREAQAYEQHLRHARGLARATIVNYVPFVRAFLRHRFGDGPIDLSELKARDIATFVQRQASRLQIKRAKLLTSALRSFLQYTRYRGYTQHDLAAAVPTVACWRMTSIPRGISSDHVNELLRSIDRRTAMGRRDYAILLLLARLGMRANEVARLELDDINWEVAVLAVWGKSGRRSELPLSAEVGQAIAAYLRSGRPDSQSRRVFLRSRAPIGGFLSQSAVGSIVRHRLKRAGIIAPTCGAHQFRHGLATEMLHRGASLGEIGDLLGHRSPETTHIYTKVHVDALRTLAMRWPGGAR